MISKRISGATRVLGKSQGYIGLAVRDEHVIDNASYESTPCMVTAWEPTPEEIERIVNGAPIYLRILGSAHPPVTMSVGEVEP